MHVVALNEFARNPRYKRGRDIVVTWFSLLAIFVAFLFASNQASSKQEVIAFLFIMVPSGIGIIYYWRSYGSRLATATVNVYTKPEIPGMFGPQSLLLDEAGVTLENDCGVSHLKWSAYTRVDVLPDNLILLRGSGIGFVIPKATLAGAEFSEVAEYCVQRVATVA